MLSIVLYAVEQHGGIRIQAPDVLQLASLILTAAALILTGVGVFVALLAFIGYREIRRKTELIAKAESARVAREVAEPAAARYVVSYLDELRGKARAPERPEGADTRDLDPLTRALLNPAERGDEDDSGGTS